MRGKRSATPEFLDSWADADIFRKGLDWALRYDTKFDPKDVALLKKAVARGLVRATSLRDGTEPLVIKSGRSVHGFVSRIDGSTQPYGVIVPRGYSAKRPVRLDVVLHGSTRPVGLSELPVKNDTDLTIDDRTTKHLILFGDPGSNRWIRDALPKLPLEWTRERLTVAGREYAAADHAPSLITANPLGGGSGQYLVLNSGHTFHEAELSTLNYLLFPRSGDWGVWKVGPPRAGASSPSAAVVEEQVALGLADENWRIVNAK